MSGPRNLPVFMSRSKKESVKRVTEELEKLRISRSAFNKPANEREAQLIGALCVLNGTDLFDLGHFNPFEDNSEVSSDIPLGTTDHTRQLLVLVAANSPIGRDNGETSPNSQSSTELQKGDRVRIKNKVNRSRSDTESDKLARVKKVTKDHGRNRQRHHHVSNQK